MRWKISRQLFAEFRLLSSELRLLLAIDQKLHFITNLMASLRAGSDRSHR